MPTSLANPTLLAAVDVPNRAGGMPASGPPLTGFQGIKTNIPIAKANLSGAVRRDLIDVAVNTGQVLAASTAYPGWAVLPSPALITRIFLVIGVAPTVANAVLTITANGVSLLAGANYQVVPATPINTVISLPLSVVPAVSPPVSSGGAGLPYLPNQASGFPFPILVTYTEGASTVKSANVAIFIEYELDDFNG